MDSYLSLGYHTLFVHWSFTKCSYFGTCNKGVSLSSNRLSLLGRCGVGDDFGTSDPQEPKEPVNFSAALLISVPSQ